MQGHPSPLSPERQKNKTKKALSALSGAKTTGSFNVMVKICNDNCYNCGDNDDVLDDDDDDDKD